MNGETNDIVKADATQEVVVQKIPMLPEDLKSRIDRLCASIREI